MKTEAIEVPACELRLDGNTYPHREALSAKGWKFCADKAWRKSHPGGKVVVRDGCRLVANSGGLGLIYDLAKGRHAAPTQAEAHSL